MRTAGLAVVTVGEVVLDVPARPEYLSLVRQVVAAAAGVPSLGEHRIEDLRIAVSEATTNAIESYADLGGTDAHGTPQRVVIRCNLDHERVEVEVADRAGGLGPEGLAEAASAGLPDPEDPDRLRRERGLGLPLIRHFADETEVTSAEGGTSVRLVVYTPWRHQS